MESYLITLPLLTEYAQSVEERNKNSGNTFISGYSGSVGGGYSTRNSISDGIRDLGNVRPGLFFDREAADDGTQSNGYFFMGAGFFAMGDEFKLLAPSAYKTFVKNDYFEIVITAYEDKPYDSPMVITVERLALLFKTTPGDFVRMQLAAATHANRDIREIYIESGVATLTTEKAISFPLVYRIAVLPPSLDEYYQLKVTFNKRYDNMTQIAMRVAESFKITKTEE